VAFHRHRVAHSALFSAFCVFMIVWVWVNIIIIYIKMCLCLVMDVCFVCTSWRGVVCVGVSLYLQRYEPLVKRNYTLEELALYRGVSPPNRRIFVAARGVIYDMRYADLMAWYSEDALCSCVTHSVRLSLPVSPSVRQSVVCSLSLFLSSLFRQDVVLWCVYASLTELVAMLMWWWWWCVCVCVCVLVCAYV
jgi:hypothetical protein